MQRNEHRRLSPDRSGSGPAPTARRRRPCALTKRLATNRKSDSRLMYLSAARRHVLARQSCELRPSPARRAGRRCAPDADAAAAGEPPGSTKERSGASSALSASISSSSRVDLRGVTAQPRAARRPCRLSGVHRSAPRSNRSFWMRASMASTSACASAVCRRAMPMRRWSRRPCRRRRCAGHTSCALAGAERGRACVARARVDPVEHHHRRLRFIPELRNRLSYVGAARNRSTDMRFTVILADRGILCRPR